MEYSRLFNEYVDLVDKYGFWEVKSRYNKKTTWRTDIKENARGTRHHFIQYVSEAVLLDSDLSDEEKELFTSICNKAIFGVPGPLLPANRWSMYFPKCVTCGTIRRKYSNRGRCSMCYYLMIVDTRNVLRIIRGIANNSKEQSDPVS